MKIRQNASITTKQAPSIISWLPILQADIETLKETLDNAVKENPFVEIKSGNEIRQNNPKTKIETTRNKGVSNSSSNEIEALTLDEKSLYDTLNEQIVHPLFPTINEQTIAFEIINNINAYGYFEGDIEKIAETLNKDVSDIEKIRLRFEYLEPNGVGAVDLYESFLFQLNNFNLEFDLEDEVSRCCVKMIKDFENLEKYQKEEHFNASLRVIKKFQNPPALEYLKEQAQIIPDIFIHKIDGKINVSLNRSYYPDIELDIGGIDIKFDFIKKKIKEANTLIDALGLRKATLTKIANMLLEFQYDFFNGGAIKPMKLDDIAEELGHHHSTISRAVSNKFLSCDRGIFPIKDFFAVALGDDKATSNSEIKSYIEYLIKNENHKKPLSDEKIKKEVDEKFSLKIGRRTVTKYRMQSGLSSSNERKRLYTFI